EVEPSIEAQDAWVSLVQSGEGMLIGTTECTPGYYNNEGQGLTEKNRSLLGHPGGAGSFFRHIEAWRRTGEFKGLNFI
ncbi:MAG: monooxygenase, partial [Pseudomonadota bacterium]